ncbi:hypothetical protein QCM77_29190, partial [Bradyrhizobium sp. SSUT18]|uniref:hypothetical protein n=1 Tax=Bradyrhizobium sp. SSUT18 TaxID=3040602 RepID=UPI002447C049
MKLRKVVRYAQPSKSVHCNVRCGSRLCKNAAPHHLHATKAAVGVAIEFAARASRPHGCQQWLDAEDIQHTGEIVAEYVQ